MIGPNPICQETLDSMINTIKIENNRRIMLGLPPVRSPGIIEQDRTIRGLIGILAYHGQLDKI